MAYLQQSQSDGYHFAENEVTHQLEQIILIRKMDEKIKHFEFREFTVGENGSVFALFNIVLQPPDVTFEHANRELQDTLSVIRSTRITAQKKIKYYSMFEICQNAGLCIINLAVERQNMDKVAYSKMLDKRSGPYRWLDYQIHLFVVSALRRCDFYDCIEKFETQITPVYHHLETTHLTVTLEVTVNDTMLTLQRKSNVTALLVCINAGFICESNSWMISSIDLQIFELQDGAAASCSPDYIRTRCMAYSGAVHDSHDDFLLCFHAFRQDICLMGRCCMTRWDGNSPVNDRARLNK
ncbi:hypothetical protein X801_00062, partial [Opisthorchis viverrini]